MLEIIYDTTGEPAIAVGRSAPTLAEPCEWVCQKAELMVYQQTRGGEFVLIHGDRGSIEPWRGVTSQAEAVKRTRNFLTST